MPAVSRLRGDKDGGDLGKAAGSVAHKTTSTETPSTTTSTTPPTTSTTTEPPDDLWEVASDEIAEDLLSDLTQEQLCEMEPFINLDEQAPREAFLEGFAEEGLSDGLDADGIWSSFKAGVLERCLI